MLKAASVAWRTLIQGTERWFCEPDGIVDGVADAATVTVVKDGGFFGHLQSDMGNVGLYLRATLYCHQPLWALYLE